MGSVEWKFARIVKVGETRPDNSPTQTCESCEYSSSSSSDSDSDAEMTTSALPLSEIEIPVRVGGCEKWITGLSKRTTCDDVIYALLANESNANDVLDVTTFAMYERWREVERPLRGRTKILKVWRAWGAECRNVRFFIRKGDAGYESGSEVMKTRRHHHHHHHNHHSHHPSSKRHSSNAYTGHSRRTRHQYPQQQQQQHALTMIPPREPRHSSRHYREVVSTHHHRRHHHDTKERTRRRSADSRPRRLVPSYPAQPLEYDGEDEDHVEFKFYGYDHESVTRTTRFVRHQHQPLDRPVPGDEASDGQTKDKMFRHLVQVVLDQERALQDQSARLKETDQLIEHFEATKHASRLETNGKNYVQDAYLSERLRGRSKITVNPDRTVGIPGAAGVDDDVNVATQKAASIFDQASEQELEAYADMCEKILDLNERLTTEQAKLAGLSAQVVSESQLDWDNHSLASGYSGTEGQMLPVKSNLGIHLPASTSSSPLASDDDDDCVKQRGASSSPSEAMFRAEIDKLKEEIERSVSLSQAQQQQLRLVEETLTECDVQLQRKRLVWNQLQLEVDEKMATTSTTMDDRDYTGSTLSRRPTAHGPRQHTSLSKFKSKSCDMIAEEGPQGLSQLPADSCIKTDDFLYLHRDTRVQYNSDSGVESVVGNKAAELSPTSISTTSSRVTDNNISEIDVNDVPYVKTASGMSMVPYFTYASYDKEPAPATQSSRGKRLSRLFPDPNTTATTSGLVSDDSNSDTGLSSLHSDDHSPVLETLV